MRRRLLHVVRGKKGPGGMRSTQDPLFKSYRLMQEITVFAGDAF